MIYQACAGWWFDKNVKYRVVSRTVTKKEANKPYKFENGVWTEVKPENKVEDCAENAIITVNGKKYKLIED